MDIYYQHLPTNITTLFIGVASLDAVVGVGFFSTSVCCFDFYLKCSIFKSRNASLCLKTKVVFIHINYYYIKTSFSVFYVIFFFLTKLFNDHLTPSDPRNVLNGLTVWNQNGFSSGNYFKVVQRYLQV